MNSLFRVSAPTVGTFMTPDEAMKLAISEAFKGSTRVSPNPLVGSVVLDAKGGFLQSGYHQFFGGPHAEVNAVKDLSWDSLKGATVFVTLEPCAHEGKTPSCARMLATLPLKKVIYGLQDPNPLVSGQGAEILRKAGIQAQIFSASDEEGGTEIAILLEEVCEVFLRNYRHKKTFVALKVASSLDGQIALNSGESQWITGPESREHVHYLRACYDAVLVGRRTVTEDNPSLNIRDPKNERDSKIVVLDPKANLLAQFNELKLAKLNKPENIFWCVGKESQDLASSSLTKLGTGPQLIVCEMLENGELDLESGLHQLFSLGIKSVLVEGGAKTASSFITQGLVNRLYVFQAPILLGAGGARSWTEAVVVKDMAHKIQMNNPRYLTFANDFMVTGTLHLTRDVFGGEFMEKNKPRFVRSKDGLLAGVCAGLGQAFGIEPWMLRAILIVSILWFGVGVLLYLILAVCFPREDRLDQALDGKILGVCARIAREYRIEVGLVRTGFVLFALITFGVAVLGYGLCYFIVPKSDSPQSRS